MSASQAAGESGSVYRDPGCSLHLLWEGGLCQSGLADPGLPEPEGISGHCGPPTPRRTDISFLPSLNPRPRVSREGKAPGGPLRKGEEGPALDPVLPLPTAETMGSHWPSSPAFLRLLGGRAEVGGGRWGPVSSNETPRWPPGRRGEGKVGRDSWLSDFGPGRARDKWLTAGQLQVGKHFLSPTAELTHGASISSRPVRVPGARVQRGAGRC